MSAHVIKNAKLWLDGYDLSGMMSALALDYAAEQVEATTIDCAARRRLPGLKTIAASHQGLMDSDYDAALFTRVGQFAGVPMSFAPEGGGAVGGRAFSFLSRLAELTPGGAVGEMFAFGVTAESSDGAPLVRGQILYNGTATGDGNGTAVQVGAAASGKTLYAALHVLSVSSADTLDLTIESDSASNFPSATTRITFDQVSAIGSQWKTLAGPITDDWWRVAINVTGTDPSIQFVVILGII